MSGQWYVTTQQGGRRPIGPLSFDQVRQMAATGELRPTDLVCQEGADRWQPAGEVPGLMPALPPLPAPRPLPVAAPVHREEPRRRTRPPGDRDADSDREPAKKSPSSLNPTLTILLAAGGGVLLLGLLCCGGLVMMSGAPVVPTGNGGGGGFGGQPGSGSLQGTYQMRANDGAARTGHITFTADGRFQEQGFLDDANVYGSTVGADGQTYRKPIAHGGQGTYRFTGTTLELTYSGGNTARMNCTVMGGGELLINTYYTFILVQ